MRAYEATSLINASAERVWQVLSDIAAWPDWNSGVSRVEGTLRGVLRSARGVIFRWIPDLGPSFQQFAEGLRQEAERNQRFDAASRP